MEFEIWHIWFLATIIFVLLEIFIPSFVMLSIATGCFFAAWGAVFHGSPALQFILFIIGTLSGFLGVKPIMIRYAYNKKSVETNAGGLVGRIGKVTEEINPDTGTGCVGIDGDQWTARSHNGKIIPVSEKVKVVSLDSIIVNVTPVEEVQIESNIPTEKTNNDSGHFTIRIGNRSIYVEYEEVQFLYSKNKITHVVTKEGKQFIHDESLDRLEQYLPAEMFFRANRQFILKRDIISEIKPAKNGKVEVHFKPNGSSVKNISVSRLKAHTFRQWLKYA